MRWPFAAPSDDAESEAAAVLVLKPPALPPE
jgi:hypothetical protein